MRRAAIAALCLLAVATSGVEARRHHAQPAEVTAAAAVPVGASQPAESHLFEAAVVPQGSEVKNVGASWVLYKQCGESWSNDMLGTAAGTTICDAGCAMSSVSMLLKTKGVDVNPGTLNSWLRTHGGYVQGDLLVWNAVAAFGNVHMLNYYSGPGSMSQNALINAINAGQGVVVNVRNGGHWVLVTGYINGQTFAVNDSGFPVNSYVYGDMSNFVVYG